MKTCFLLFVVLLLVGCQPSVSSRLLGTWQGVPDSRAGQLARDKSRAKKTNDSQNAAKETDGRSIVDGPSVVDGQTLAAKLEEQAETKPAPPSDLESLDFTILIEFAARGRVTMQLVGDATSLAGTWQIIETRPNGALVEITRLRRTTDDQQEKRRFEITFEGDDAAAGFRLKESGADPRFGLLYFSRVAVTIPSPPVALDNRAVRDKPQDNSE